MIGSASIFIAIGVILSAIVSMIASGGRRQAVLEGRARAQDLCELTGVFDPRVLQDLFGPPTLDGIYHTTMERVKQVRQPLGYLIADDRLNLVCIAIAFGNFIIHHPVGELFLMAAAAFQTAGWFVSSRFKKS